jgi:hypothetical protein
MSMILLLAMMAANPQFEARQGARQPIVGPLVELSPQRVVVEALDGPHDLAGQVTELSARSPMKAAVGGPLRVDLVDGSSLAADDFVTTKDTAEIRTGERTLKLPLANVDSVRFQQQSEAVARQWNELVRGKRTGDVMVVRKADAIDHLNGILGDVGKETIAFEVDGETIPVKRTKIAGIIYAPLAAGRELPAAFCTLVDAAGSRVAAEKVEIADGKLHVASPAGLKLDLPLEQIRSILFKVQYLSDLEPESADYIPYLSGKGEPSKPTQAFFGPRFNPPVDVEPLRLGGRSYSKGLALHSRTELVYRLPGKFRLFQALAGIDDSMRPSGDVKLSIYGDGRLLVEAVLTGREAPRTIEADLHGVARLKIVVDFDGDEVGDLLDLCEARVLE